MAGEEPPESTTRSRSAPRVSTSGPHSLTGGERSSPGRAGPVGGHPLPAAAPSTHIPTLPPKGPAAVRHIGVVLMLCSIVVVIVVLTLALALPNTPKFTASERAPARVVDTPAPIPTTTTAPADAPLEDLDALAPVPMTMVPLDGRQKVDRTLARRGLRAGDVPALDALVAKSLTLEKNGRGADAMAVLKDAQALVDKQQIDRGFVFAKQKRLNIAVDDRGTKDAKRFDELSREVERRFAARDYSGANEALNKAFNLLK
ncbi:MAG: hypothetical protein Q8O67_01990 [Deltaproteobacteria bacterium]|nr:hypothetical protein [Deltaproteobacteria bacterium]